MADIYSHALDDVPIFLNPICLHRAPKAPAATQITSIPPAEDIFNHDFELELRALDECALAEKNAIEAQTSLKRRQDNVQQMKQTIEKQRLKKVAPGLSDSALEPVPAAANASSNATKSSDPQIKSSKSNPALDFLEFEQGLPPKNPWDTDEPIMSQLQQVLGGTSISPKSGLEPLPQDLPRRSSHGAPSSSSTTPAQQNVSNAASPSLYRSGSASMPTSLPTSPPPYPGTSTSGTNPPAPASSSLPRQDSRSRLGALPSSLAAPLTAPTARPIQVRPPMDLNPKQQQLYTQLMGMGFSSLIVDASCRSCDNEKEAVEFCMSVDDVAQRGPFAVSDVLNALVVLNGPPLNRKHAPGHPKVQAYLQAMRGVKEMGFTDERAVQLSLQFTDPDVKPKSNRPANNYDSWTEEALNHLLKQ
jgi:hypothetical protein